MADDTMTATSEIGNCYTYWVEGDDDYKVIVAMDANGNTGRAPMKWQYDEHYFDAITGEWLAFPIDYITDMAVEAEFDCEERLATKQCQQR